MVIICHDIHVIQVFGISTRILCTDCSRPCRSRNRKLVFVIFPAIRLTCRVQLLPYFGKQKSKVLFVFRPIFVIGFLISRLTRIFPINIYPVKSILADEL